MILWFATKVLEYRLLPVTLHIVPVIDLTMADRIVDAVSRRLRVGECLIADEEVEVLNPALGREVSGSWWYSWS